MDPVVAEVVAHRSDDPGPDGVPGQGVDPEVVVDVDVEGEQQSLGQNPAK